MIDMGKIYQIDENLNLPELFHIHTYKNPELKWNDGMAFSTSNFPTRIFAKKSINEIYIENKEKAFERIRTEEFNNYPSRYNCLFAIEWSEMEHWIKRLKNKNAFYQIVKLKFNSGKLIKLDDCPFDRFFPYIDDNDLADYYWNAMPICPDSLYVYLFEGDFMIKKVLKEEKGQ